MAERPTKKQHLKVASIKARKSISREETHHLVMSMGSGLQAVIDYKEFCVLVLKIIIYINDYVGLSNYV